MRLLHVRMRVAITQALAQSCIDQVLIALRGNAGREATANAIARIIHAVYAQDTHARMHARTHTHTYTHMYTRLFISIIISYCRCKVGFIRYV